MKHVTAALGALTPIAKNVDQLLSGEPATPLPGMIVTNQADFPVPGHRTDQQAIMALPVADANHAIGFGQEDRGLVQLALEGFMRANECAASVVYDRLISFQAATDTEVQGPAIGATPRNIRIMPRNPLTSAITSSEGN